MSSRSPAGGLTRASPRTTLCRAIVLIREPLTRAISVIIRGGGRRQVCALDGRGLYAPVCLGASGDANSRCVWIAGDCFYLEDNG